MWCSCLPLLLTWRVYCPWQLNQSYRLTDLSLHSLKLEHPGHFKRLQQELAGNGLCTTTVRELESSAFAAQAWALWYLKSPQPFLWWSLTLQICHYNNLTNHCIHICEKNPSLDQAPWLQSQVWTCDLSV